VTEKHEYEDLLPRVYLDAVGTEFVGERFDDHFPFDAGDLDVLREKHPRSCSTSAARANQRRALIPISGSAVGIWEDLGRHSIAPAMNLLTKRSFGSRR